MHYCVMRTHASILADAGIAKVQNAIPVESVHTIRSWGQRGSIPAKHWAALANANLATLEELAIDAAARAA